MSKIFNELKSYQSIPRELVFDDTLSDRARFVYVFMSCKPEGWDFFLEPMAKEIKYSVDTLRKYINELVANGWLEKGEQENENGRFGATSYILRATKFTDTENFRHGKNPTQHNIENINIKEIIEEKKEIDKSISKKSEKDSLFEECWVAYRRKGVKKKAYEYWKKLSDAEKQNVLPHIKAYVSARDLQYQKDFERYLRDKVFSTIVFNGNKVVYDPTKFDSGKYTPQGNTIWFDEKTQSYWTTTLYFDFGIDDGYSDNDRPDGASLTLNNARGEVKWSKENKRWLTK